VALRPRLAAGLPFSRTSYTTYMHPIGAKNTPWPGRTTGREQFSPAASAGMPGGPKARTSSRGEDGEHEPPFGNPAASLLGEARGLASPPRGGFAFVENGTPDGRAPKEATTCPADGGDAFGDSDRPGAAGLRFGRVPPYLLAPAAMRLLEKGIGPYSPNLVEGLFSEGRIQDPAYRAVRAHETGPQRPARAYPLHAPCYTIGCIFAPMDGRGFAVAKAEPALGKPAAPA
jgi:hypothetical protein